MSILPSPKAHPVLVRRPHARRRGRRGGPRPRADDAPGPARVLGRVGSQWYAEPKRLAELGLLHAEKTPGQTHERTHYTLTDAGREALRAWLAEPSAFTRIQCEPIVRLLAAEYVDPEVLAALDRGRARAARGVLCGPRRRRGARAAATPPRARAEDQPSLRAAGCSTRTRRGSRRPRPSSGMQQPGEDDRVQRGALVELLVGRHDVAEQGVGGPELEGQIGEIGRAGSRSARWARAGRPSWS